jgi:hypothetical protein
LSDKDEARVDAVLAGDDDDGPGAGYRPSAEDAAVLAEIDAILGPKFAEIAENISERAQFCPSRGACAPFRVWWGLPAPSTASSSHVAGFASRVVLTALAA